MTHPLEIIYPRNLKHLAGHIQELLHKQLWAKVIVGMLAGLVVGLLFGPSAGLVSTSTAEIFGNWLVLPGKVFIASISMIVLPLVLASVIRGIASSGDMRQLKSMGLKLVFYFLFTTTVAIVIGITIALLLEPGSYVDRGAFSLSSSTLSFEIENNSAFSIATIPESIVGILPNNLISAAMEMDMLKVVLFSIIFGLALVSIKAEHSKPLLDFLGSVQHVVMKIVAWIMHLAPFAVFGFIAEITMQTGFEVLIGIGAYVGTVLLGLFIMLLFYLSIVFISGAMNPIKFLTSVWRVQLLAFSTDSSVATLPYTMKTAEEKLKVRPSTAQFVLPIGATVNMDGTAMFQGAATIFLTQVYGIELSIGVLIALVVTAIGASIGTPATPGVGIVILSVVLTSIGIPLEGVALIIGVDRIIELFRTAINVTGDMVAALVMDKFAKSKKTYEEEIFDEKRLEHIRSGGTQDTITLKKPFSDTEKFSSV